MASSLKCFPLFISTPKRIQVKISRGDVLNVREVLWEFLKNTPPFRASSN